MKLVYLEWCDAIGKDGWHSLEEAKNWGKEGVWRISQVGWIIEETDEYLLLSGNHSNVEGSDSFGQLIKIPKTWIRKRKIIKI